MRGIIRTFAAVINQTHEMKRTRIVILLGMALALCCIAQTAFGQTAAEARKILDRAAAIVGNKNGVTARFDISGEKIGKTAGTISIKGNKFQATTPQAIVWYNGTTQWTYVKKNNEVNVSAPDAAKQLTVNPTTFLRLYKKGYKMSATTSGSNHLVHLTAEGRQQIQEAYVLVSKQTGAPVQIKVKRSGKWMVINISGVQQKKLSDATFTFNAKDYPTAEVIDLR